MPAKIIHKNKYLTLFSDSDDEEEAPQRAPKAQPPPVIILPQKNNLDLHSTLQNLVGDRYSVKYTRNNANIYTSYCADYECLRRIPKRKGRIFYVHAQGPKDLHLRS